MAKFVNITRNDTILTTEKVTKGLFTGDLGTVAGSSFTTSSLSTTQKAYYYTMQLSGEDQFSIAYGHSGGSGSSDESSTTFGKTRAIYKQFASLLLPYEQVQGGFIINSVTQSDCYFISFERARYKDRVNRKNWTLALSGSSGAGGAGGQIAGRTNTTASLLELTDNSEVSGTAAAITISPVGPVYSVVSGSQGTAVGNTEYGLFYPNVGVIVLSQQQLSASLPGTPGYINSGSNFIVSARQGVGFARDLRVDGNADNAGKLRNSINLGGTWRYRSEEDQTSVHYFCRARANEFNFSSNPTFLSGSRYGFAQPTYEGNPQVFITTVGLYNNRDELVAVGRLSSPVLKNYSSEATIKVKLTY